MSISLLLPLLAAQLLGGLGIFHFGLTTLGGSLRQLLGQRLHKSLESTAGDLPRAVAAGALMAALGQSSAGTLLLVIGFAGTGILPLQHTVGLIMGANIGTTVTAQLLRLGESLPAAGLWLLLDPMFISYVLLAAAALTLLFAKKKRLRTACRALSGLALLFVGMHVMENAAATLGLVTAVEPVFEALQSPALALLAGLLLALLLRSSTLSIALLQALAVTAMLPLTAALPVVLGINIGACLPVLLSARDGNPDAKRAALLHLLFNFIGAIPALFLAALLSRAGLLPFAAEPVTKTAIAHIHTLFNLGSALLLLPFRRLLVRLAVLAVPSRGDAEPLSEEERLLGLLDPRFAATPAIALEQCRKVVRAMGQRAFQNVRMATAGIVDHTEPDHAAFAANEAFLDTCEARINTYLLSLKDAPLSEAGQRAYTEILHSTGEFEQIGDYAENLHERYGHIREENISFSAEAVCEIGIMSNALEEMSTLTLESFENSDGTLSACIDALEEIIDRLKETLRDRHIQRLQQGLCTVHSGIPFLDIIHDLEKIADHCSNISIYVLMYDDGVTSFDLHKYHRMADEAIENHSQQWQDHYEERYLRPILGPVQGE